MASRLSSRLPSTSTVTWRVAQALGAAILFKDYIAECAVCAGDSMLPTLRSEGNVLLVEKLSTTFRTIKRGDVVVCVSPEDPDKLICKRVIGLVCLDLNSSTF
jgi:inner membrane protease subunit 1